MDAVVRLADKDEGFDLDSVTPGVVGFFATFLIAAVTVLLLIDMNRRVRRTRYRTEIRERLAAEREVGEQGTAETEAPAPEAPTNPTDPADPTP
nr:hypothetical protein [Homoserinimonas aerilata]